MATDELDDVDKGILYLLQQNARNNTTADIGEKIGVSSSTVGNRINKLEECGVITGYHPTIDYEETEVSHHLLVTGTIPFDEHESIVDEIIDTKGVVNVRELLTDRENASIELVGRSREDVERSLAELHGVGVEIERTEMIRRERTYPYDHFGKRHVTGGETG
jgi:DNA-binding Lrp family transcriptional regulator